MKTYISTNELSHRLRLALPTLKRRLREQAIENDAVVINGSRPPAMLFDSENLPSLRARLIPPQPQIQL